MFSVISSWWYGGDAATAGQESVPRKTLAIRIADLRAQIALTRNNPTRKATMATARLYSSLYKAAGEAVSSADAASSHPFLTPDIVLREWMQFFAGGALARLADKRLNEQVERKLHDLYMRNPARDGSWVCEAYERCFARSLLHVYAGELHYPLLRSIKLSEGPSNEQLNAAALVGPLQVQVPGGIQICYGAQTKTLHGLLVDLDTWAPRTDSPAATNKSSLRRWHFKLTRPGTLVATPVDEDAAFVM